MAWIVAAAALVVAAGLIAALIQRNRALKTGAEAARELGRELDEAKEQTRAVQERVAALEAAAADFAADAAAATAAAVVTATDDVTRERDDARLTTDAAKARLTALWALVELAEQRAWRLSQGSNIKGGPDGLPGALAMEVDCIREEVGTPGSLAIQVDPPVAPDDAAFALVAARELLAILVPHTQAYDVVVGRTGSRLAIEVVCSGWEGPDDVADDVSRLLAAVAPTGGDLQLDADSDERLRVTLQLPLGS